MALENNISVNSRVCFSKLKVERQSSGMLVRDVKDLTIVGFYICFEEEATTQDMYENQKAFLFLFHKQRKT